MKNKTITFLSILTDTLVANPELGLERLPKAKERLAAEQGIPEALDIVALKIQSMGKLNPQTKTESFRQVIESLEQDPSHEVKVIGGIMRWSARHSGLAIEA